MYRGRRKNGQDATLPFEVHVLWFPNRAAFDAYLADERRAELLRRFGEVFTSKQVVELETISRDPRRSVAATTQRPQSGMIVALSDRMLCLL